MAFTWLENIGKDVLHFFEGALHVAQEVDTIAAPFINVYSPQLQSSISIALTAIAKAEALGTAAANTDQSNAVKLASVISEVAPQIAPILASVGIANPTNAEYTNFINGLVAAANAFTVANATTTPTTTAATTAPVANGLTPTNAVAPATGAAVSPK